MCGILLVWLSVLARFRLSDSGEDAKLEGTLKVSEARKWKKGRDFLPFYFRDRAFSIQYLGTWNRLFIIRYSAFFPRRSTLVPKPILSWLETARAS